VHSELEQQLAKLIGDLESIRLVRVLGFSNEDPLQVPGLRRLLSESRLIAGPNEKDGFAYSPRWSGEFTLDGYTYGFQVFLGGRTAIKFPSGDIAMLCDKGDVAPLLP
jgi:hypothetical protein